jgi:methyl-accepting chemotaxis protein
MATNESEFNIPQGGFLDQIKNNITAKLILAMSLMAALPLAIAGGLIYRNTAAAVQEQAGRAMQEVAGRAADSLAQTVAENAHLLESLAASAAVQEKLRQAGRSRAGSEQQIIAGLQAQEREWGATAPSASANSWLIQEVVSPSLNPSVRALQGFKAQFPSHVDVILTDKYGATISSARTPPNFYRGEEEWWRQAYQGGAGAVYVGKPELDKSAGTVAMVLAVPVRGPAGETLGVLRSTFNVKEIVDALAAIKSGRGGRLVIADSEGRTLFDPARQSDQEQKLPESLLQAEVPKKAAPGWTQGAAFDGVASVIGYSRPTRAFGIPALERLQWTAVATMETREALATVLASTRIQLGLGFIVALVAIGLAFFLSSRLTAQIKHINNLFKEIRGGNHEMRAPVVTNDELGQMTADLNTLLDETLILVQSRREREDLQNSIMRLLNDVSEVAEGDLTVEAEVSGDITGAIADAFNYMIAELREIIGKVQDVTQQVDFSAHETRNATERLAEDSEGQARQILAARETIEQVTASMRQVSEIAVQSGGVADQSLQTAKRGAEAVQNTIRGMGGIRNHVQETAKHIKRLGEHSQEIGEIVRLISDIAYRTSVLALNASIQAARAGEAGRGFAVVAEEVEQLSKRSTEASNRIADLVKTIQAGTTEAIAAMEESTREVVEGSRLADQAGRALSEIEDVSAQLAELIRSISTAAEQQAQGSQAVSRTMVTLSEVTQRTASGIKQSASTVNNLAALANDLSASVASFKLGADKFGSAGGGAGKPGAGRVSNGKLGAAAIAGNGRA